MNWATVTLADCEQASRPITWGPRRGAQQQSPNGSPPSTKTTAEQRAALKGYEFRPTTNKAREATQ